MEYTITTRSRNVEVYDVPVIVATWIADHLPDLDYIQDIDIAVLATHAVRAAALADALRAMEN